MYELGRGLLGGSPRAAAPYLGPRPGTIDRPILGTRREGITGYMPAVEEALFGAVVGEFPRTSMSVTRLVGSATAGGPMALCLASCVYSRLSESARLGTTKDKRKIGKMLFPLHRKLAISPSATSKVLVRLEFRPLRTCRV